MLECANGIGAGNDSSYFLKSFLNQTSYKRNHAFIRGCSRRLEADPFRDVADAGDLGEI